eukprot:12610896-Alexandrium_andersonii.AAC.1
MLLCKSVLSKYAPVGVPSRRPHAAHGPLRRAYGPRRCLEARWGPQEPDGGGLQRGFERGGAALKGSENQ